MMLSFIADKTLEAKLKPLQTWKQSRQLLEIAKPAVERAIETDDATATT